MDDFHPAGEKMRLAAGGVELPDRLNRLAIVAGEGAKKGGRIRPKGA
jgi:hypothetical protein